MAWWNDAKKAFGMGDQTPEEADHYPEAERLLADEPVLMLTRHAIEKFEDAPATEVLKILGGGPARDSRTVPSPGADRRNWIRRQVTQSFRHPAASTRYDTSGVVEDTTARIMRTDAWLSGYLDDNMHEAGEDLALDLASRYVAIGATGVDLMRRVEREIDHLVELDGEHAVARFSQSPPARIDAYPAAEASRRAWLRDMLIGENASVRSGAVPPDRAMAAARRISVDVPLHDAKEGAPHPTVTGAYHQDNAPWSRLEAQAQHLHEQDPTMLRQRFSALPGVLAGMVVVPHDPAARLAWTRRALTAEHVRRIAGLGSAETYDDAATNEISIEVEEIVIGDAPDGSLSFEASLLIDGVRICDLLSGTDGSIDAVSWAEGCGPADLTAVSAYVEATGSERETPDGGLRKDSLVDRVLDQVSMHAMTMAYRAAAADAVFYVEDADAEAPVLLRIAVPDQGSRQAAADHARGLHPGGASLDDMDEADAVMIWMTAS